MNILLDFFENYREDAEVDPNDLEDYREAIENTQNLRIKHEIARLKESAEEEIRGEIANDLWCDDSNNLRDMTYHISAPITYCDAGRWDGHHIREEDTEEEKTLSEWIDTITDSGRNFDDYRVYTEDGEVWIECRHHDGTNLYRFGHHLAGEIEKALGY